MSESVKVRCPGCQTKLRMKGAEVFGRKIRCPQCGQAFQVNAPQAAAPRGAAPQASPRPVRPKKTPAQPRAKISDDEFLDSLLSGGGDQDTGADEEDLPLSDYQQDLVAERRRETARAEAPPKKKKKKRRAAAVDSGIAGFLIWFAAASVGGLIGAALWAGLVYATHREFGIAAWAIGGIVGFSVLVVKNDDGSGPGIVAGIAAFLSILVGKFAVAVLIANLVAQAFTAPDLDTPEVMIARVADEVMAEWEEEGREVEFADAELTLEDLRPGKHLYAAEVWAEAEKRWNAKTPEEQETIRQTVLAEMEIVEDIGAAGKGFMIGLVFIASFGWLDLLWFSLAIMTAYRVALGIGNE